MANRLAADDAGSALQTSYYLYRKFYCKLGAQCQRDEDEEYASVVKNAFDACKEVPVDQPLDATEPFEVFQTRNGRFRYLLMGDYIPQLDSYHYHAQIFPGTSDLRSLSAFRQFVKENSASYWVDWREEIKETKIHKAARTAHPTAKHSCMVDSAKRSEEFS